jgi:hypothetical protein
MYWATHNSIEKMIVEPIRMLKNFPSLKRVKLVFGDGKNIYDIDITAKELEIFTKYSVKDLTDDLCWQKFVNTYIYSSNNPLRKKLFDRFTTIKKITTQNHVNISKLA